MRRSQNEKTSRRVDSPESHRSDTLEQQLARLQTSRSGLSSAEAENRFAEFGPNEPATVRLGSKVAEFVRSAANPLVVILLVAGAASAFLGEVTDAAIISGIVLMSAGINFWQTFRSERAVKRLQEQIAPTANVFRDGSPVTISRRRVVVGDVVHLAAGDLVPADARLI